MARRAFTSGASSGPAARRVKSGERPPVHIRKQARSFGAPPRGLKRHTANRTFVIRQNRREIRAFDALAARVRVRGP